MKIHCIFLIIQIAGFSFSCQKSDSDGNQEMKESYLRAYQFMQTNPTEAIKWSDMHIKLALALEDQQQLSKAYFLRAYIYDVILNDPENALKSYLIVLDHSDMGKNNESYFNALANVGELYFRHSYIRTAVEVFGEGLLSAKRLNEKAKMNRFVQSLAAAHFKLESWSAAENYIQQGLVLSKEVNDTVSQINYSIMECALLMKNKNFNSVIPKLEFLLKRHGHVSPYQKIRILNNLGINHLSLNQLDKAEFYFNESLLLTEEIRSPSKVTFNNLAKLALKRKEFGRAEELYHKAELLPVSQLGDEDQLNTYDGLVEVYAATDNPRLALQYKQKAVDHIKPLIAQIDKLRSFAGKFEEWQQSREMLETKRNADVSLAFTRIVLIIVIIAIAFGAYLMAQFYRGVRRESELRILREISEYKDAIIRNIRLLF
jgi:tetratricopeptide (TPR) repeat protein